MINYVNLENHIYQSNQRTIFLIKKLVKIFCLRYFVLNLYKTKSYE